MSAAGSASHNCPGGWNHNTHYHRLVLEAVPRHCATALDVGCGSGELLGSLAARTRRVVGIDTDADSVRRARERCAALQGVRVIEGDFLAQDFDDQGFDFVVAVASLHHRPLEQGLERARQLLRPGGTLFVVGVAKPSGPGDLACDVAGTVVNRLVRTRRGYWHHGAPTAEPTMTYEEVRRTARTSLPGASFRRRLYFRYTLAWQRPGEQGFT